MGYQFSELVDLKRVKSLMQLFYDLTGLPSTLLDLSGNILRAEDGEIMGVGWKSVCLDFHRVHPATLKNCHESDTGLANSVNGGGRATCYQCHNGLVDAAAPVVIAGRHLCNLFTGQFLFEPPDEEEFRRRARQFGFDEEAYLAALREIPVFSRAYVEKGLAFLDMLAGIIAEMGLKQRELMELNRQTAERSRLLERALADSAVARQQAEAANQAKTRFLAMVSHELRSPLQNLEIYRSLLARAVPGESTRRLLDGIGAATERMSGVVTSILHHSSIESGRITTHPAEVRLDRLAAEVVADAAGRAAEKGLDLAARLPPLPPAVTDPRLVRLALANLVDNALKYTEPGGRVEVRLAWERGEFRYAVADSGPGIRPEDRARVFEPFEQGESVSHKHLPGVGLGLALARNVAQLLGGRVELESQPGRGSTFSLVLPPLLAEAAQ